jgi:hypothetical protein
MPRRVPFRKVNAIHGSSMSFVRELQLEAFTEKGDVRYRHTYMGFRMPNYVFREGKKIIFS